jgi:hypothetical protein
VGGNNKLGGPIEWLMVPIIRLNLAAATRIHILEAQWNPSVEEQAIGRAVRIGQEKNATVIRYVVERSIEEVIRVHSALSNLLMAL